MVDSQLLLFDWPASIMGEGYRKMAVFRFEEAEQFFSEVRHFGQGEEEEINKALHACRFWQALVQQNKESPDVYPSYQLYEELRRYPFGDIPGLHQLKEALLQFISERLLSDDRFYIYAGEGNDDTVPDLLLELRKFKKAERTIVQRIENHTDDIYLRYLLAQVQWLNGQKGEAKKNYARGLLGEPCRVPSHRILYKPLHLLIEDVGAAMAPAFGWVRGVLPLVPEPENLNISSESHRRAVKCYRLLWSADRAVKNNNIEACVECRKKLKAEEPGLYDEYFALLSGANPPGA